MRDSMVFYRSFFEAIKELPTENKAKVFEAVFEYGLNFKELELEGIDKTIFTLIKPQLDANIKKYNNGKKQKISKSQAKDKQTVSKTGTNVNDNDNVNDNVLIKDFKSRDHEPLFMQLKIDPELIEKYSSEFTAKLLATDEKYTKEKLSSWWFNWLKLQPKKNYKYLTTQEKERKQVPTDRIYIHWKDTYKMVKEDKQGQYITDPPTVKIYL